MSQLTRARLDTLVAPRLVGSRALDAGLFGRTAPTVLEVGSGHGAAAVAYAATHPHHDLVAVDVHPPGLARMMAAAHGSHPAGLPNLWVHRGDAVALLQDQTEADSLAAVHVFFPDPWPKAKHLKRRLIQVPFLDLVHSRLQLGGQLLLATDDAGYADHMLARLHQQGRFQVTVGQRPAWRPQDGFEAKGRADGRSVTEISARRVS